jgi:hypothetical protein
VYLRWWCDERTGINIYSRAKEPSRPAWVGSVGSGMASGAPPRRPTPRPAGDDAVFGGNGTRSARERPASLHGAGRPGAAPRPVLLSLACSLLIIAASCMCTFIRCHPDGIGTVRRCKTSRHGPFSLHTHYLNAPLVALLSTIAVPCSCTLARR